MKRGKRKALTAVVCALVRFIEAFGLWRRQAWAEWFGILSGSICLLVEVHERAVSRGIFFV